MALVLKRKERSTMQEYYQNHINFLISKLETESESTKAFFRQVNALYFEFIYPSVEDALEKRRRKNGQAILYESRPIHLERSKTGMYDVFDHIHCLKTLWKKSLYPEISMLMLPCVGCSKVSSNAIDYVIHFDSTRHLRVEPENPNDENSKMITLHPLIVSKALITFHLKNLFHEEEETTLFSWIPKFSFKTSLTITPMTNSMTNIIRFVEMKD